MTWLDEGRALRKAWLANFGLACERSARLMFEEWSRTNADRLLAAAALAEFTTTGWIGGESPEDHVRKRIALEAAYRACAKERAMLVLPGIRPSIEHIRDGIELRYSDKPTGTGASFGEILCHEINENGMTFCWLAEKWGISVTMLGNLIADHCRRLEELMHVPPKINGKRSYGEPLVQRAKGEDLTRCIVEFASRAGWLYQCVHLRGHGPGGLFCTQHSKMAEKEGENNDTK